MNTYRNQDFEVSPTKLAQAPVVIEHQKRTRPKSKAKSKKKKL